MKIVKEIGVVFVVAIIMIITLGIILYSKLPSQKNIPEIKKYTSNEQYNKIINENVEENKPEIKKYDLNSEELSSLEQKINLKKGRSNPFLSSFDINARTNKQGNSGNSSITNGNTSIINPSQDSKDNRNTQTETPKNAQNNSTEEGRILNRSDKEK